jgi:hypothetical protein
MKKGRTTSIMGALVFLSIISLILFCAAVASWAPYNYPGYELR